MSSSTIIILILIGIIAGMLSGLVGVGGGIIVVPCLVFFMGLTQKVAQGNSLALLLLPVGIFAVINYYRAGHIDVKMVGLMAIGFVAGGYFGSKLALNISDEKLKKVFAILMIIIAIKMLFFDKPKPKADKTTLAETTDIH